MYYKETYCNRVMFGKGIFNSNPFKVGFLMTDLNKLFLKIIK